MSDKRTAEEGRFAGLALAEEELVARVASVLLPRRADPERYRRTPRAAAPEDLPPAGERPSVRGDPRADQLPLRGLPRRWKPSYSSALA